MHSTCSGDIRIMTAAEHDALVAKQRLSEEERRALWREVNLA